MNSSNTNLIKDEYEIACIELENEPPSTDLDMEGNALSDRFETDSLLSNVIKLWSIRV